MEWKVLRGYRGYEEVSQALSMTKGKGDAYMESGLRTQVTMR
jgi:hypothetical protein